MIPLKKILQILTWIVIFGQLQLAFSQTTITMQKIGNIYTVPCSVNGLQLRFIFDTGASDVSISLTEALFMLKNGYLKKTDILGKQYFANANGDISVGTIIILRRVEFAGIILSNVEASVVNDFGAPLLLGQTAISKLGKIQLDPSNNTLTILNGSNNYTSTESTDTCIIMGYAAPTEYNTTISTETYLRREPKSDGGIITDCHVGANVAIIDDISHGNYYSLVKYNGCYGYIAKIALKPK